MSYKAQSEPGLDDASAELCHSMIVRPIKKTDAEPKTNTEE